MTEVVDRYGQYVAAAPETLDKAAMCLMTVTLADGSSVACGYAAGHRSEHSWSRMPGAISSVVPYGSTKRFAAKRGEFTGARKRMAQDACAAVEHVQGEQLACANGPLCRGPHSWHKLLSNG